MTNAGTKSYGPALNVRPHAYDPDLQPEYFAGVLPRRIMAFIIDVLIISIPVLFAAVFILVFGVVTLGLGWLLFWLLPALATVWAVVYYGFCFAAPASATLGMRVMDIEMRTWYGERAYFVLGAVHVVLYWISVSVLTPFILLISLLNERHRLLHDMILGTIVVNNEARAQSLRGSAPLARPV